MNKIAYLVKDGSCPSDIEPVAVFLNKADADAYADADNKRHNVPEGKAGLMGTHAMTVTELPLNPDIEE